MADHTVRVRVTQEDIDAGERADCCRCPAALAIKRDVPGAIDAFVTYDVIEVVMLRDMTTRKVRAPDRVTLAIAEFDAGYPMSPFEFDLPLPTLESADG